MQQNIIFFHCKVKASAFLSALDSYKRMGEGAFIHSLLSSPSKSRNRWSDQCKVLSVGIGIVFVKIIWINK